METREGADVVIPREVVKKVQERFDNVLYGYFLGNRLPFPVVEYYAKNVWSKFGFEKIMMNSNGFFFFKFDSQDGMQKVLEGGPWLIRKIPLFLNVWTPSATLKKDGIKAVPVWVKLHNVPIAVYTDDGLSLLASKIGVPKRLDSFTADMCADNWGRSSFARAMVEINADNELKEHILIAIPKLDEEGYIMEQVDEEYEWKQQRCSLCCIFGHNDHNCAKNTNAKLKQVVVDEEGFVTDKRRLAKMGKKQKPKVIYKPKIKSQQPSTSGTKNDTGSYTTSGNVHVKNNFDVLAKTDEEKVGEIKNPKANPNEDKGKSSRLDDEVEEVIPTEMSNFMRNANHDTQAEGASTPGHIGLNG
ncbi:uncharacterized protein LOC110881981 [Helianthus annuus]|uniref:uncharacterized protein LOC110881981 n=1 Tax=Helianthus annuus TaxID=4232 RepID=UPI000B8F4703|nr:uncharacterized protein LOC110881981 [Helianthus annuus]